MKLIIAALLSSFILNAMCVDERVLAGMSLKELALDKDVFIEMNDGTYEDIKNIKLNDLQIYHAQIMPKNETFNNKEISGDFTEYNRRYIEYYTYPRLLKYLKNISSDLEDIDYKISKRGKSLEGRDLFYIGPKKLDPLKKTIVMFGRHHGDEGTANWIIEGFLNEFIRSKQYQDFQLLLYPMINPDGAMAQKRYNANGRDLNRSWSARSGNDEIAIIHKDLREKMKGLKDIKIVLDMHGSFREDFIYRVDKGFKGRSFYQLQQNFISELGYSDPWQKGHFILSNGHPKMSRIVLIKNYGLNALTHETIRNIPLRNNRGRSKSDLLDQGIAIVKSVEVLY